MCPMEDRNEIKSKMKPPRAPPSAPRNMTAIGLPVFTLSNPGRNLSFYGRSLKNYFPNLVAALDANDIQGILLPAAINTRRPQPGMRATAGSLPPTSHFRWAIYTGSEL